MRNRGGVCRDPRGATIRYLRLLMVLYWLHQWGVPHLTWGFIRNLRLALVVYFGFFNEEYLIALVDLIVALRRTKGRGRRTLRSPPSPSSGLHLIHPEVSAAAGKCRLPRVYRDIGFRYPVQVAYHQFRMLFCYLCSGYGRSRFSWVAQLVSHVSHYWGRDRLFVRLRRVLQWSFVGFALTAIGAFVLFGNGMG